MKKLFLLTILFSIIPVCPAMNRACIMFKPTATDNLQTLHNLEIHAWPERKELIIQMIKNDPCNVNMEVCKHSKDTPLHASISRRDAFLAFYVLQYNPDIEKMDFQRHTPLYNVVDLLNYCTKHPNLEVLHKQEQLCSILKLLIIKGANPDYEVPFKLNNWDLTNATPRSNANPAVSRLIEQAEQKK